MDSIGNLRILPTGQQLKIEIAEQSQVLRNCHEAGDPEATRELFYLLILNI